MEKCGDVTFFDFQIDFFYHTVGCELCGLGESVIINVKQMVRK